MSGMVSGHPHEWLVDVVVIRSGGKDPKGNPLPSVELTATECLIGPRATTDPIDHSDVISATAVLYRDPGFTFLPADRIRVPPENRNAGMWMVDGLPGEWPEGSEVGLVKG